MLRFNFTKQAVRGLDLPIGTHYDLKQSGLVLNVTASSRRFGVYIWANGMPGGHCCTSYISWRRMYSA